MLKFSRQTVKNGIFLPGKFEPLASHLKRDEFARLPLSRWHDGAAGWQLGFVKVNVLFCMTEHLLVRAVRAAVLTRVPYLQVSKRVQASVGCEIHALTCNPTLFYTSS